MKTEKELAEDGIRIVYRRNTDDDGEMSMDIDVNIYCDIARQEYTIGGFDEDDRYGEGCIPAMLPASQLGELIEALQAEVRRLEESE